MLFVSLNQIVIKPKGDCTGRTEYIVQVRTYLDR